MDLKKSRDEPEGAGKAMSNTGPSVTPERILQFVWAFAPPLAIEAAIHHRVFDVLAKQPMSIAELAQAIGASTRGLSAIADLLVGFALLTRDDEGRYALTPESDAFLVSHKPSFTGGIFRHMSSQLLPNWLQLSDIVGSGKPATAVNSIAEGSPFFAQFVEDILPLSYPSAHMLANELNLAQATGPISVLDLASGSGVWGIALAQASPGVTVRAVDWPDVLPRRDELRSGSRSASDLPWWEVICCKWISAARIKWRRWAISFTAKESNAPARSCDGPTPRWRRAGRSRSLNSWWTRIAEGR
jgi:hypothetical protein